MTLPEGERPGKPRKVKRRGLFLPWFLALLLVVGWSVGWFWLKGKAIQEMDAAVAELNTQGYEVAWRKRDFSGFPFRLDVRLEGARIAEPSGWAVAAPVIKAETTVIKFGHWVIVADDGITLTRPDGGPVSIRAQALRASLSGLNEHPPRLSVEGLGLAFETAPGAKDYWIRSADRLEMHLRQNPDNIEQGAMLFKVDGARLNLEGLPARIVQGKPASVMWDLTLSKMNAFKGRDWADAVRDWQAAGGRIMVTRAEVRGGDAVLSGQGGPLTVDADGRLRGTLKADLRGSDDSPAFGGQVVLKDGKAVIGPLPIGPSPRLY
ncbi:MAG: DUF2125 domain-containing protein [Caulobacter sp.]|nr:DUF2125 domain-containing protein [Caulobacter sp.]